MELSSVPKYAKVIDGEVYYQLRRNERMDQENSARLHMLSLSPSKRRDLKWLLERQIYTEVLDLLVDFPGLRFGLEFGNIRRLFALRCDEELIRYLQHTYNVWKTITLGRNSLENSVDLNTVRILEALCPLDASDRTLIETSMESGILFPSIKDIEIRNSIRIAILQLEVIIPTIKTFHENSKILQTVVQIVRSHLAPCNDGSLQDSLRAMWRPPEHCLLETQEGVFHKVELPIGIDHAYFVYLQLIFAALRRSSDLNDLPPRRDDRKQPLYASRDPNYVGLFIKRAKLLGYSNEKIERGCNESPEVTQLSLEDTPETDSNKGIRRRFGRPFGRDYRQLQTQLFISHLHPIGTQDLSAIFIRKDLFKAFFEPCNISTWDPIPHKVLARFVCQPLPFSFDETRDRETLQDNQQLPTRAFELLREQTSPSTVSSSTNTNNESTMSPYLPATARTLTPRIRHLSSRFMNTRVEETSRHAATFTYSPSVYSTEEPPERSMTNLSVPNEEPLRSIETESVSIQHSDRWETSQSSLIESINISTHSPEALLRLEMVNSNLYQRRTKEKRLRKTLRKRKRLRNLASQRQSRRTLKRQWQSFERRRRTSFSRASLAPVTPGMSHTRLTSPDHSGNSAGADLPQNTDQSSLAFNFMEYNGMRMVSRSVEDMGSYLKRRKNWVAIVMQEDTPRSLRLDHVIQYIRSSGVRNGDSLVFVKQPHAERFRIAQK